VIARMDWKTFQPATEERLEDSGSFSTITYLCLFGLAITIPLLLLLGALLLQSASAQRAQLQNHVLQAVDALVSDLDRDLDRDITILHTLATSQALARADWPTFYDQARAGLQGRAYLVLTDSDGRQLVNTYVPYGQQPAMTGDPETIRRIVQAKEPIVSNYFVSLVVKKPVFNVSIPILQDGHVRYVMSLGRLPDDLVGLLTSQNFGSQWVTLVWDGKGVILARSQNNGRYIGRPLPEDMREHDQRAFVRTTNLDGTDVLHATARSRLSGWGVGVNVPYSLVAQQMRNSLLLWGVAAILAITIALALGLFFARPITTSLSAADKAAAAFGKGEAFALTGSRLKEADEFLVTLKNAQRARQELIEELKRNRDWLQTTLSSIGDAVIATDANGMITLMNPVAESLTGWAFDDANGQPLASIFRIVNQATREAVENPVDNVRRLNKIVGLANHTILISKNGQEVAIDDSGAPIRDPNGTIIGIVLIFRDVTRQRALESALQSNERLALAGRLSASIAHEIHNPLDTVGNVLFLLDQVVGTEPKARQLIATAQNEVQRVADISKNMLSLHRDSRTPSKVKLSELLNGVLSLVEETIAKGRRNIEVMPGFDGEVETFPSELRQVFTNVIKNAIEATDDGGNIRIYSEAVRQSDHSGVLVRVVDDGMGVPEELQSRLFNPFVTTKEETGTGLGLWVSRSILEKHGGSIQLTSSADPNNLGTTVSMFLPLKFSSLKVVDIPAAAARGEAAS
jgi:PAS domain S-box-containing protein